MKMDEYEGKQFLATVRGEDFAHAGEVEAIDLVFESIPAKPNWTVLDVGCGRGGTANYVNERGWGHVVGVDIDRPSIEYAQSKYPALEFSVCAMESVGKQFPEEFDLLYLFNVFYASQNKRDSVISFRKAAKPGGTLCIFDYVNYKPEKTLPAVFLGQKPATPEEFETFMKDACWQVSKNENLDQKYIDWYRRFLARFDDPTLKRNYSAEVIESVRSKYSELLTALESGALGGVLLLASAQ
jgi:cyclopropane fatty-acyl-phospholipid synthase-like methyltransferase